MKKKVLFRVITRGIKDRIQISKSRRPKIKYWDSNNRSYGSRYNNHHLYRIETIMEGCGISPLTKIRIFDIKKNSYVLSNPRSAGNPRYFPVNTQRMYQGMHHSVRTKMIHEIKDWFRSFIDIKNAKPIHSSNYPIHANLTINKYVGNKSSDVDNMSYIYMKCFMDVLKKGNIKTGDVGLGIIEDDDPRHYRGYCVQLNFVSSPDNESMIFELVKYHQH